MKFDRNKFLALALSMGLGQAAGCVVQPAPQAPQPGYTQPAGPYQQQPQQGVEPGNAYQQEAAPADECVDWDPSGECIGWASQSVAPADECVDWDPSGECIGWAGDSAAPADECVDWDPSGECIGWE